jgi:indolepyruvate decarboxylase
LIRGLGVLVTTYGVGELSAMNAVAGAFAERTPVVVIASSPSEKEMRSSLMHHSLNRVEERCGVSMFAEMHGATMQFACK